MRQMLKYIILLVSFLSLLACTLTEGYSSPEEAFFNSNIRSKGILQKIEVNNGAVLFYEVDNNDVGVGLVREEFNKWNWVMGSGMVSADPEQKVTYTWMNLDQMGEAGEGYHIFWGSVSDNAITKLHIDYNNRWELDKYAEFFDTPWDYRIWYVILDEFPGIIPGIKIDGYNDNGELIFKNYN